MNKLAAQAFIGKMICSVGQLQLVICNMIKLARCKACAVGATVHFRACIGVRDEPAVIQNIKEKKKEDSFSWNKHLSDVSISSFYSKLTSLLNTNVEIFPPMATPKNKFCLSEQSLKHVSLTSSSFTDNDIVVILSQRLWSESINLPCTLTHIIM